MIAARLLLVWSAVMSASAACLPWDEHQNHDINLLQERAYVGSGSFTVHTAHFIVTSEVDARFSAEMGRYLELFASAAIQALDLPPALETTPAVVTVYGSRSRYQQGIGRQAGSRGQFDWSYADDQSPPNYTIRTFIAGPNERDFSRFCLPILNHEVTHLLLQQRAGRHRIPDAIHEGVASYLQAWDPFHDVSWNRDHRPSAFAVDLKRSIADGSLPSFALLTVVSTWDVDGFGPLTNARYASAESYISFLAAVPTRGRFLRSLLDAAFSGSSVGDLVMGPVGAGCEHAWRASLGLSQ